MGVLTVIVSGKMMVKGDGGGKWRGWSIEGGTGGCRGRSGWNGSGVGGRGDVSWQSLSWVT